MEKTRVYLGGAVATAVASSLCCVLPLIAVIFGLGSFGAAAFFDSARPFMLIIAFGAISFAFYQLYFRELTCSDDKSCSPAKIGRSKKAFLWVAATLVLTFALAPYYSGYIAAAITRPSPPVVNAPALVKEEPVKTETVTLGIRGMTCDACETHIEVPLRSTIGVTAAEADYKKHSVTVTYDPTIIAVEQIRDIILATGYELL